MLQALRIRDFRLLWGGGLVSSLGSWLMVLAIPAHVFLVTGSLRATGLTLAADYLPLLVLGPVAGVFTDRWDRRRLMIAADLFRAGAVAGMLLGTSPGRYWVLYFALIAESSGTVLFIPALQARTPAIVGTGTLLSSANSLSAVSDGAVRLIGGPLGGILLTVYGIKWLICADVVSYLLSAVAMLMTSRPNGELAAKKARISDVARGLTEGVRVLGTQPVARALLPVTVIFLAANASLSAMLIPFGVQRLGGSEQAGVLLACLGAGFLLGAPIIRVLLDRFQPRNLLTASLTATAAAYFLLFTSSSPAMAARRGSRRHVRLDVASDPADCIAAGDPQCRPRPGQRSISHRRGSGHPYGRSSRAAPGASSASLRPGHHSQPRHARRSSAHAPTCPTDIRHRPRATLHSRRKAVSSMGHPRDSKRKSRRTRAPAVADDNTSRRPGPILIRCVRQPTDDKHRDDRMRPGLPATPG